jgi:hypothetical protein
MKRGGVSGGDCVAVVVIDLGEISYFGFRNVRFSFTSFAQMFWGRGVSLMFLGYRSCDQVCWEKMGFL